MHFISQRWWEEDRQWMFYYVKAVWSWLLFFPQLLTMNKTPFLGQGFFFKKKNLKFVVSWSTNGAMSSSPFPVLVPIRVLTQIATRRHNSKPGKTWLTGRSRES
ncbi:hypothetical protein ATANTOWER_000953 [Ataeniobius toweri]|uniref:Uncharacterized protein n=1 Tax=Ataeniobius toweri TaxID=208326 RepID=A0ABU7BVX4_9TELE|nr:hypothetical protein [Ataeniobius toweri]